jgi:hypothetical protein
MSPNGLPQYGQKLLILNLQKEGIPLIARIAVSMVHVTSVGVTVLLPVHPVTP